jgi:rod shape-determining protein MreD
MTARPLQSLKLLLASPVGNCLVTALSAVICVLAGWVRLPGTVLADLTPNWPLIWVVCWSVNRAPWQAVVAGIALGWAQDALTSPQPTHALGLAAVGLLTARLHKRRFMKEDFILIALVVFGMTIVAETVMALQWTVWWIWVEERSTALQAIVSLWRDRQPLTVSLAILSSLWAPAVYLPLRLWWQQFEREGMSKHTSS